jgi:hypothetical protein
MSRDRSRNAYVRMQDLEQVLNHMYPGAGGSRSRMSGSRSVRRSLNSRSRASPFEYNYSPAPGGTVLVPLFQAENGQFYAGVTPGNDTVNPYMGYYPYEDEPLQTAQYPIYMGRRELGVSRALGNIYGQRGGSPTYYEPIIQDFRSQHARQAASRRPGFAGLMAAQGGAAAGAGGGAYLMPSVSRGSKGSRGSRGSRSKAASAGAGLRSSRSAY